MARKRVRVDGIDARLTLVIALLAGVGVVLADVSPTGSTPVDVILVLGASMLAIWGGASAPWWSGVAVATIATALAPSVLLIVVGGLTVTGGLAIGLAHRAIPWSRALVAGLALQVLARLGDVERFGLSAAIAITLMAVLALLGILRRPRRDRRVMWWTIAGLAAGTLVAGIGVGVAGASARGDLDSGNRAARKAIDLLADGHFDEARVEFQQAAASFASADNALGKPWTQPARLVPVVAQHRNSAVRLVADAADVSSKVATLLGSVDFDQLRVVNGRIDVAAIEAMIEPLTDLNTAIDELDQTLVAVDSPWLVDALRTRLVDLAEDIDRQQLRGADALLTVQRAPAMLGADRPRVYFIAFTTPVEARGLGGFMGNWAEVTITEGKIELTRFGRTNDLITGGQAVKRLTGPEEFIRNYGEALMAPGDDGVVTRGAWARVTASPHFPSVAQVIAELYPQSGGTELDGVFAVDVETVAWLMQITGPVTTSDGVVLTERNVVDFLLREQYLLEDREARIDLLEEVAQTTMTRLLTTELPSAPDLADLLGPMTDQGRLVAWAADPAEEAVYEAVEMSGEMPPPALDGLAVTFNNGVGNKIDLFLESEAVYSVHPDPTTGVATATLSLTLTNTAPADGLPRGLIGNDLNIPDGVNRTYLSVYTVLPFTAVTIDGVPGSLRSSTEAGYELAAGYIDIGPGETVVVEIDFEGPLFSANGYELVLRSPPTALAMRTSVLVDDVAITDGPIDVPGVYRLAA